MTLQFYDNANGDGVNATPGTSNVQLGDDVMGLAYINSGTDKDVYYFGVVSGHTYTFAMNGIGIGALSDGVLRLLDSGGTALATDDNSGPGNAPRLSYTATATGTLYLEASGSAGKTGGYAVSMNDGSVPYMSAISTELAANYLTNSYWEVNGSRDRHFDHSNITVNITGLDSDRIPVARATLSYWADVANITFTEVTGTADITFDDASGGAFSSSTVTSGGVITHSDINIEDGWYGGFSDNDTYTTQTFIHEIGHALGLGHAGPYNGSATYGLDNAYANDTWQMSAMSYHSQNNDGATYRFTMTPMMADVEAIRTLYGANTSVRSGDTVYGKNATDAHFAFAASYTSAPAYVIVDAGGNDWIDASDYAFFDQVIDLRAGHFSSIGSLTGNIGIANGVTIENAKGGNGNDTFYFNDGYNTVWAGTWGGGNDTYIGGSGMSIVDFGGASGLTTVNLTNGSAQAVGGGQGSDTFIGVHGLRAGSNGSNFTGGNENNMFVAGAGNDTFNGGGGIDIVSAYYATAAMTINLATGSMTGNGTDSISNFENVEGSNGFGDTITGTSGANELYGYGGNDAITGGGGNDTIGGGAGIDTAYFSGAKASYTISLSGSVYTISGGSDGTDTLTDVEYFHFTDQTVGTGPSDLSFSSFSMQNWTVTGGDSQATFTIQNTGSQASAAGSFGWYWSADNSFNAGSDTFLGSASMPSIAASGSWSGSFDQHYTFASNGYMFAVADYGGANSEPNELNNVSSGFQVQVVHITSLDSNGFDAVYYLEQNPDVAADYNTSNAWNHYNNYGWHEGRNPNAFFDTNYYLSHNADVAAGGGNPLIHFRVYGWNEDRDPGPHFDLSSYLAANPDIDAANIDPLQHFYNTGLGEGRDAVWV